MAKMNPRRKANAVIARLLMSYLEADGIGEFHDLTNGEEDLPIFRARICEVRDRFRALAFKDQPFTVHEAGCRNKNKGRRQRP